MSRALLAAAATLLLTANAPAAPPSADQIKARILGNPAEAISMAERAMAAARAANQPLRLAEAEWLRAEAINRIGDPRRAAPIIASARSIVEAAAEGSQLNADILLTQGDVQTALGDVSSALSTLQRAHEMYRALGEARSQTKALISIALMYAKGADYESALRYFDEAAAAYRGDPALTLAIANGRGNALQELKRFDRAAVAFEQARTLAQGMKSPLLEARVVFNLARIHLFQDHVGMAERDIATGLSLTSAPEAAAINDEFIALKAWAKLLRGDHAAATSLIAQRFRGVDLTQTTPNDWDAHEIAYRVYSQSGDPEQALRHLQAMTRLNAKMTEIARSDSAALAGARFDFANQELRIAQMKARDLQRRVANERARARTMRWMFIGGALAGLLVLAALAFGIVTMRRSRNRVRAANVELGRTNEALGKALAAKTEFLATTSHEIRTPLNGILGMTQVMLADHNVAGATRDRLTLVHTASTTMRALVDDILDVAKMENGDPTIAMAPIDLAQEVAAVASLWRDQAEAKGLVFTLDLSGVPTAIEGDAARLRQILSNLLSNAVKFTADGAIAVRLSTGDGRYQIAVHDTGIGIDPSKHETIFDSFQQADSSTTRHYGGTGLGLTICRRLARAMAGDVRVESAVGAGALFTLDLPLIVADAAGEAEGNGAGNRVVVVDRNPIARATLIALFAPACDVVDGYGDLTAIVETPATTAILIDHATLCHEGDPVWALGRLKANLPDTILALLCHPLADDERTALAAAGIDRFLVRPIAKNRIVDLVLDRTPLVSVAA